MCSIKKLFLEILQKNICARVSFLIKLHSLALLIALLNNYCSCCITLIKIDTILSILSNNIWNSFQNLLFKKLLTQSGDQTEIFWKFYSPPDTLWSPKTVRRVLGYTTGVISGKHFWHDFLCKFP